MSTYRVIQIPFPEDVGLLGNNYYYLHNNGTVCLTLSQGNCSPACRDVCVINEAVFQVNTAIVENINSCLKSCDLILAYENNVNIVTVVDFDSNNNLYISSNHSITSVVGAKIRHFGKGVLGLMVEREEDNSSINVSFDDEDDRIPSSHEIKYVTQRNLHDEFKVSNRLFLPKKTTVCTTLSNTLQGADKYRKKQIAPLAVGSLVFVGVDSIDSKIVIQQYSIDALTKLSDPISIFRPNKEESVVKIEAQSNENVLLVMYITSSVQNNHFQIGYIYINFQTRQFYRHLLGGSDSFEFFLNFYDVNKFRVIAQLDKKWVQYFATHKSEFLRVERMKLPDIYPKEMLFLDVDNVLFCECTDDVWKLRLLQNGGLLDIHQALVSCDSSVFLSRATPILFGE